MQRSFLQRINDELNDFFLINLLASGVGFLFVNNHMNAKHIYSQLDTKYSSVINHFPIQSEKINPQTCTPSYYETVSYT